MGFDAATLSVTAVVFLGVIAVIGVLAARKPRRAPKAPPPHLLKPVPGPVAERAKEVVAQGRQIQAVKEIREITGYDLRTAKAIADTIRAGQSVPVFPEPGEETAALADRVRELRDQQRMVDAIRLLVERTGMNEAEAARTIEALD
ncbi:50S ribosomal protein L7/L12 [Streptomonospora litoralis]|uniref:Ribosomal protein L7/L12 C-terminal domain-containing protein n=1 Tax=Streptomonospora litoralis TaxID=2498135 RepID=A0A4P6Q6J2_9ACTN|nr:50S ribosomal protein L7/L12 [Streptomonospora litoralis]QBI54534.1 hypothetical protein EKD16_13760 [Streptomonospora litoralis]